MGIIKQSINEVINFLKSVFANLSIILFCISVIHNQANGECPDSKGTDFWQMFNSNVGGSPTISLYITSDVNTSGTVSIPGLSLFIPFTVVANTFTTVSLPSSVSDHISDVIDNKGVHITSLHDVTVYGSTDFTSTGTYLGLPTDILGTNYLVLSYKNSLMGYGTQFGVVAVMNNTAITITPKVTTGPRIADVPYIVMLNQGDTYELRNESLDGDLTGTAITSTQPIGVMGSHSMASIPADCLNDTDHICEMLPPVDLWGKNFLTVPLKTRLSDTWRILASENGTTVRINSIAQSPINAGQFIETILTSQSIIISDKPVLVAQYSNCGSQQSNNNGSPFMMIVPPIEQYSMRYTMTSSPNSLGYINIVVPNSIIGSPTLTFDQAAIPVTAFSPIGASGYSYAQLDLSTGAHTLQSSVPIGCLVYGLRPKSFGSPAGFGGNCCSGIIKAPQSLFYIEGNYPVIPNVSVSNFSGTGSYNWELISNNPTQCPGATGSLSESDPFNITLNQRITMNCTYTLKISRDGCTAQTQVTLIPCPCE